jgi:hypothetical protein
MAQQPDLSGKLNEKVLAGAWAQLSVYDGTASELKNRATSRRKYVILLTLIASVTSIIAGMADTTILVYVSAILAISLPIVASYLMNDTIRFTGTSDWIKYRYIAETMRMHIYLYRMLSGEYAKGPVNKMDDLLSDNLSKIRGKVSWDGILPPTLKTPIEHAEIEATIKEATKFTPEDTGLTTIPIESYIKWRVDEQRKWYDKKVSIDFRQMRIFFRLAQVTLLIGAIIGAVAGAFEIRVVVLIAVTTAIASSLTAWSNTSMYGTTYSIFMITSQQLGDLKRQYNALSDNPEFIDEEKRPALISEFVHKVESVLEWEREEWFEMALQAQSASDKVIMEDLKRLTQRAKESQQGKT